VLVGSSLRFKLVMCFIIMQLYLIERLWNLEHCLLQLPSTLPICRQYFVGYEATAAAQMQVADAKLSRCKAICQHFYNETDRDRYTERGRGGFRPGCSPRQMAISLMGENK